MNISYRWLQELVPGLTASPRAVADRLAMLGAPVDEVVDVGAPLQDIVIARLEQFERHPNADRLNLCTVEAGAGYTHQVVCGAPNVKAQTYYPFAPVGASLPGDVTIRKAKIRGVESQGMLCSARELGLGRDHDGIMELHGDFEPGTSFVHAMGLDDTRLVVDVTPNRPDLLSHIGIAREIAAAEGLATALHALPGHGDVAPLVLAHGDVGIRIDDAALCPKYLGLVIRGVRVGPSPAWLASRLRVIGLRPISNVVDATNWVLHELGQPLHAFDLAKLGNQVVVRTARSGERITTLDGQDRALQQGMLVIADAQRPVAVAGVMGGADTEVGDDTVDILLECALFDAKSVRTTRRALNLSTDASYRFERGVNPDTMLRALQRAAELIVRTAGGTVDARVASAGAGLSQPAPVRLRLARVQQVLGERFDATTAAGYLRPLGFDVVAATEDNIALSIPGHRRYDVAREEDLIEEIARRHGYDNFSDELRPYRPGTVPTHPLFLLEDRLRTLLVARGFMEAHTAAFAPEADGDVALMLPLATTESRLRRSLTSGLLRRVEHNFARGARSIRLFEIGTAFSRAAGALPEESTRLALAFTGHREPPHWTAAAASFDAWDMKGIAGDVAAVLGLTLEQGSAEAPLDPDVSFRLVRDGTAVGHAGRVRGDAVDAPAWADDVWALEVVLEAVAAPTIRYRELPQQPAIERDLALVVRHDQPAADVAAAIRAAGGALLESAEPFDLYAGKGVPADRRSIAFRLRFRAPDRTLTDAEVDTAVRRVLQQLNDNLGVEQRA